MNDLCIDFDLERFGLALETHVLVVKFLGPIHQGCIGGYFSTVRDGSGVIGGDVVVSGYILKFMEQDILIFLIAFF